MQEQQVISAEMAISDVISKYPDTIHVFFRHGLGCVGCAVARFENIRQGAMAHGVNVEEFETSCEAASMTPETMFRARAELRRTLSVLKRTLGEGWLRADRETIDRIVDTLDASIPEMEKALLK